MHVRAWGRGRRARCRRPAHRLRDKHCGLDLQRIQQRRKIVGHAGTADVLDIVGVTEAALVEHHDAMAFDERPDLPEPARVVAADAVREHNRRSLPVALVVQLTLSGSEGGHACLL